MKTSGIKTFDKIQIKGFKHVNGIDYAQYEIRTIDTNFTKVALDVLANVYKHGASQQTKVINFIVEHTNANKNILLVTVAQLVELTGVSKPTVIEVLKILEEIGFIARKTGAIIVNPDFIFKGKDKDKCGIMITFNKGLNHE